MRTYRASLVVLPCILVSAAFGGVPANGAEAEPENAKAINILKNPAADASLFDFSYGPPDSPVLPLIGVQSDQITRVDSFRKLGLSLLSDSESAGAGQAFALDFSPYWLLKGPVSLQTYRDNDVTGRFERIAARAKGGMAVSEGDSSAGIPSTAVFSVATKLLSSSDPLLDRTFENCVVGTNESPGELWRLADQVEQAGLDNLSANPLEANQSFDEGAAAKALELRPAMERAYRTCADLVAKEFSRRSSFDVGAGVRLNGEPGKFEGLSESGTIVWGTFATGEFGALSSLPIRGLVHARYTFSEDTFDTSGVKTGSADAGLVAVGLENVPGPEGAGALIWSLQAGWNKQGAPNSTATDTEYWRYLASIRARLGEGLYINATVGRVTGSGITSDTYLLVGVSFAPVSSTSAIDNFYTRLRQ